MNSVGPSAIGGHIIKSSVALCLLEVVLCKYPLQQVLLYAVCSVSAFSGICLLTPDMIPVKRRHVQSRIDNDNVHKLAEMLAELSLAKHKWLELPDVEASQHRPLKDIKLNLKPIIQRML